MAECPYPSGSTICDLPNTSEFADPIQAASAYLNLIQATSAYQNQDVGVCLAVIAETTSRYSPPITEPTAGAGTICWASQPIESLPLEVGIPIPLNAVQMGAEYDNFPAENLGNGLLRGFLPESAAFEKFIPNDTPLVGGMRLSSLLRGGGGLLGSRRPRPVRLRQRWRPRLGLVVLLQFHRRAGGIRRAVAHLSEKSR